ncbi:MAG TPA: DUF4159 domain-containing protein [Planctomycetota bacterium]|nr:DUF4159 domain-containing protein [Planctomycetota bacterium]
MSELRLRDHLLLAAVACFVLLPATSFAATPPQAQRSAFTIARLKYGGGGDWYGDQSSLRNLMLGLRDRAGVPIGVEEAPVVSPTDEALFNYPMIFMAGHGNVKFTPAEVERLRRYLTGGGFLWCDDDYGIDVSFRRELERVLPGAPLVELPFAHPVFHQLYDFPRGLPKIHEHDGGPARAFGAFQDGRMVVFYSYDTDLGDGLEDAGVHPDAPEKRDQALRMGINIVLYAMGGSALP